MSRSPKPLPNEVADLRLSQGALHRLHQFHAAYLAGRPGGRRAMLRDCDLAGLDFSNMNFAEAIFVDCDFTGAIFDRTIFRKLPAGEIAQMVSDHAIWVKSQGSEGARADFSCVDLTAADFSGRNLCLADLSGALLADAQLQAALLIAADFRGANLTRANLRAADLRGANFLEAHRRDIDLTDVKVGPIPGLALATRGLS